MTEVPCIDIAPFLAGDDASAIAAALAEACSTVGFLQIVGHGIEPFLLDDVHAAMDLVAALDPAVKAGYICPYGHPFRGWLQYSRPDGLPSVERVQVNRFDDGAAAVAAGVPERYADYFVPNTWIDCVASLRPAIDALFARTQDLGFRLMSLFGVALGVGGSALSSLVEPNVSTFAINHFPPRLTTWEDDPVVVFPQHADSGTLTILHQRGTYEGLELLGPDGVWTKVPVVPEALVINIGELMGRWTNGRWRPTVHRVVSSPDPNDWRTTLTTFHLPAIDTRVAPLANFVGDEGPLFDTVTPYEWEAMFLARRSLVYNAAPADG